VSQAQGAAGRERGEVGEREREAGLLDLERDERGREARGCSAISAQFVVSAASTAEDPAVGE